MIKPYIDPILKKCRKKKDKMYNVSATENSPYGTSPLYKITCAKNKDEAIKKAIKEHSKNIIKQDKGKQTYSQIKVRVDPQWKKAVRFSKKKRR